MGIPKFFRWISERYPASSQLVTETSVPPFDKFYLDMNGIIHHCSHGNSPGLRRPNSAIFADILGYLELLVAKIKPKQILYLAVDGVAPRAKMNQQRARRFRSAQEAKTQLAKNNIPLADSFDSNCITPGTLFMEELCVFMKNALAEKVSKDPNWASFTTIFSGPDVPGEGEHKIMHYIRTCKAQPGYDPNVRHCLHGLDADLILLGLLSHDPHFALLREEIKFANNRKSSANSGPARFYLMHLGLLREYIGLEFSNALSEYSLVLGDEFLGINEDSDSEDFLEGFEGLQLTKIEGSKLKYKKGRPLSESPSNFSTERVIDDIILLMTLVGNDFLPHLPHLHIHDCAVAVIWAAYKRIQPSATGKGGEFRYVNEFGKVNYDVLKDVLRELLTFERECYLKEGALQFEVPTLSNRERNILRNMVASLEIADCRSGFDWLSPSSLGDGERRLLGIIADESNLEYSLVNEGRIKLSINPQSDNSLIQEAVKLIYAYINAPPPSEGDPNGLERWKQHYHDRKLGSQVKREQIVEDYVCGIQWVMSYYYDGVGSWSWFYPHHYAPHLSDLYNFLIDHPGFSCPPFIIGEPFSPLNQLMAVLPPESASLIPVPALRTLLTTETSPLADFYPRNFRSDMNGKRNSWEAVVLIPFIDERRLVDTVTKCLPTDYTPPDPSCDWIYSRSGGPPQPFVLPPIPAGLIRGLCEGVQETPGFPRLGYLPHALPYLAKAHVNLFPPLQPSTNYTLCLHVDPTHDVTTSLRPDAYFGWPFVTEAKVSYSDDGFVKIYPKELQTASSCSDPLLHEKALQKQREFWYSHFGVRFSGDILVYGHVISGMQLHPDGSLHKKWSKMISCIPWPLLVPTSSVRLDERFRERRSIITKESFVIGTFVLCPNRGKRGIIKETLGSDGKIRVNWMPDPFLPVVISDHRLSWKPSHHLAKELRISPLLLARLSASLYVYKAESGDDFKDIGLGIKFEGREKAAHGYARRHPHGFWEYSPLAEEILKSFVNEFRDLLGQIEHLSRPVLSTSQLQNLVAYLDSKFPERKRLKMVEANEDRLDPAVINTLSFRKTFVSSGQDQGEFVSAAGLISSQIAHLHAAKPSALPLGQGVYICDRLAFGLAAYVVAKGNMTVEVKLEEPGPTGVLLSLPVTSVIPAQRLASLPTQNVSTTPKPQRTTEATNSTSQWLQSPGPFKIKAARAPTGIGPQKSFVTSASSSITSSAPAPSSMPLRPNLARQVKPQELFDPLYKSKSSTLESHAPKPASGNDSQLKPIIIRKKPPTSS